MSLNAYFHLWDVETFNAVSKKYWNYENILLIQLPVHWLLHTIETLIIHFSVFLQRSHRGLIHSRENVCMTVSKRYCSYAVGSQSHIDLLDPRCPNTQTSIVSKHRGSGKCLNHSPISVILFHGATSMQILNWTVLWWKQWKIQQVRSIHIWYKFLMYRTYNIRVFE